VADALGNETDFTYNIADQPLQTNLPATGQQGGGHSSSLNAYLYTGGPLTGVTASDESGTAIRQVNYTYGPEGETLGVGGSTEPVAYTYDGQYRLSMLTDGNGNATRYYYKQQGELDAVTYPGYAGPAPVYNSVTDDYDNITGPDSVRCPAYDPDGNLLRRIDGNGVETNYTHNADPQSLLTNIHYVYPQGYTGGTTGDVSLAYDAYGRRASMTDGTGSQNYGYDDGNHLLSHTTTYTGVPAQNIGYGYYPNGSRQSMSTPAGGFSYTYDAVGRETGLTNPFGDNAAYYYYYNGWLQSQESSSADRQHYLRFLDYFNPKGLLRLRQININNSSDGGYGNFTYDGVGNRTAMSSAIIGSQTDGNSTGRTIYQYDAQSANPLLRRRQLTQEQFSPTQGGIAYTNTIVYDSGNGTGPGNPTTLRYGHNYNSDNQEAPSQIYDGNGNPAGYNGHNVAFDPENQMIYYGLNTLNEMFGYTGDGLRAWKEGASGRTYFLYDDSEPVCELGSSGNVTATNTFGANGLVSRHSGGNSVFYTFDPSGNVAQRFDSSFNILSTERYDAFGGRQTTATSLDVFGFGGQWGAYTDAETGLVLMTHRYYDPNAGRFLTRDPMGYAGGINLYAYTGNDPVNRADPSGLYTDICVSVGGPVGVMGGVQIDPTDCTTCMYGGGFAGIGPPVGISIQNSPGHPTPGGFVNGYGGFGPAATGGVSGIGTNHTGPSGSVGGSTPGAGVGVGYVGPPTSYGGTPGFPGGPSVPTSPYSGPVAPGMPGNNGPGPGDPGSQIPM